MTKRVLVHHQLKNYLVRYFVLVFHQDNDNYFQILSIKLKFFFLFCLIIHSNIISQRNKKTFIITVDNTQVSSENSKFNKSISSSDYDESNHRVNSSEQMIIDAGNPLDASKTSIISDKLIPNDILEQTKDILQLKTNSNKEIIDNISNLSLEKQTILKLATENLIQAVLSNRINKKSNILNERKQKFSPVICDNDHQQSKHSSISEVSPNETDNSIHHPKCVTAQPSFAMHSSMPRVPTRSNVITLDESDEEDERSYDNYINTSKHIITTNEQFENILTKNEQKSEDMILLKDSIAYNNEQPDWAYYSTKPDLFPNDIQSDLPIVQSEDQHLSFKQTILSHFYRRPKFTSTNNPATFHSSSFNASDYIKSFESTLTLEEQRIAQKLLNDKTSFNYIWNKTLNHLKQRIFRVRKSRIIISFDDIQQQKDTSDNNKNNLNTLVNNVVQDMSAEINNEQQTKITNNSVLSLFQSFDSAIHEGELLIHNDKSIDHGSNENDDSLLEISNNLHNVTSQLILI